MSKLPPRFRNFLTPRRIQIKRRVERTLHISTQIAQLLYYTMSEDGKSLLQSSAASYGTRNRHDEESQQQQQATTNSRHSRTKSWHRHDSNLMAGSTTTKEDHTAPDSAFAPLIRTMSSGRAAAVIGSAVEKGIDEGRKVPSARQQHSQEESTKGGKLIMLYD